MEAPSEPVISSAQNKRLRQLRQLTSRRGRRKAQRTIIVGAKIIADAARAGLPLEAVFVRDEPDPAISPPPGIPTFRVRAALLAEALPFESAPEMVAIAPLREADPQRDWPAAPAPLGIVVACGVQDPGNLGTILRSAWFLGLEGAAILEGSADPWSPKVQRAAIASVLSLPPARWPDARAALDRCRELALRPVLLETHGGAPLPEVAWPERCAFFLGEEGQGFQRQDWGDAGDLEPLRVTIPGRGAESLNVAAAFAIVAYAWSVRRTVR